MVRQLGFCGLAVVILAGGCHWSGRSNRSADSGKGFPKFLSATKSTVNRWKPDNKQQPRQWDWATAIPQGLPRSDRISPTVNPKDLLAIVPNIHQDAGVRLVSFQENASPAVIQTISNKRIGSFAELEEAAIRAQKDGEYVQVGLRFPGPPSDIAHTVDVSPASLVALRHVAVT